MKQGSLRRDSGTNDSNSRLVFFPGLMPYTFCLFRLIYLVKDTPRERQMAERTQLALGPVGAAVMRGYRRVVAPGASVCV
jgi:hypothetical protein